MDAEFWRARWRENTIGFHEGRPNRFLVAYGDLLVGRVLVPLCGKAEDLAYLAGRGHEVIGVELVEDAVRQFFAEHDATPTVIERDGLVAYSAGAISIFAGDFFATTWDLVGRIDTIYDRAALIALPADARWRYAAHLRAIAPNAKKTLLVSVEHATGDGPPFSVDEAEIRELFAPAQVTFLDEGPDPRGRPMTERCYEIAR